MEPIHWLIVVWTRWHENYAKTCETKEIIGITCIQPELQNFMNILCHDVIVSWRLSVCCVFWTRWHKMQQTDSSRLIVWNPRYDHVKCYSVESLYSWCYCDPVASCVKSLLVMLWWLHNVMCQVITHYVMMTPYRHVHSRHAWSYGDSWC